MKKVMVFIGGYLPGKQYGGPVTSIKNFSDALGDTYDIRIVCCNHDLNDPTPYAGISEGWNQVGKAKVCYLADSDMNLDKLSNLMAEEKPDLIYGSGIMYYKVNSIIFKAAKANSIPVLLAPRGDLGTNALKVKAWKKKPFLAIMRVFGPFKNLYYQATSEEEVTNLQKYLGIDKARVFLLPNIPAEGRIIKREPIQDIFRVVFVSRIQAKKNLLEAIRAVNLVNIPIVFDIYGPMENEDYWLKCSDEIKKAPDNVKIQYRGVLETEEAKTVYSKYDCMLFPTLSENYGHVIAEALLCGCPVVISKGTTPWDDIDGVAGKVVSLGDVEGLAGALEEISNMSPSRKSEMTNNILEYINKKVNRKQLIEEYTKMMEKICK